MRRAAELALLLFVLVGINVLGARHFWRGDFTRAGLYALSDGAKAQLAALGRDVEIYALVQRGAPGSGELRADLDELLQRMRQASPHLRVRFVDADREPDARRLLASRFALADEQLADGVVVVAAGEQWKALDRGDLADVQWQDGEPHLRGWRGESALLGAIADVTSGRAVDVCVVAGHGEPAWSDAGDGEGWSAFVALLRRHQLAPRAFTVDARADLAACPLVVMGSPETSWTAPEVAVVGRYLDGGGRVLALLGPSFDAARGTFVDTGLESLWHHYGVALGQSFVVDVPRVDSDLRFHVEPPVEHAAHPIARAIAGKRLLFDGARPVRAENGRAVELAHSSSESWGERELFSLAAHAAQKDPTDEPGPLPLGVAVDAGRARLVVWGSSEIAAPLPLVANQALLLGSIDWLLGRDVAPLPARPIEETRLLLDDAQRRQLLGLAGGLPLLLLALGGLVFWRRR